ncbi:MAG: DUF1801 domain-containing protein [Cyclobacteriaceae bacterium]
MIEKNNHNFFLTKSEPTKGCLFALRDLLLRQGLTETTKYGMPCFCQGKKTVCYLWTDKNTHEPYILFVEGRLLDHPLLESGDRKRMKILRIDPREDLEVELITKLLNKLLNILQNK